jgi:hypothetical protein
VAGASPRRTPVTGESVDPAGLEVADQEQSYAVPANAVQLQRTGLTYRVTCGGVSTFITPMGRLLRSSGRVAPVEAAAPDQEPPTSTDP